MKTNNEIIKEEVEKAKEEPITDFNDKVRRSFPAFFILLCGVIIGIPLISENISHFNEFRIHIVRIVSVLRILKNNIFPPMISPYNMSGFGYAINVFYGPITTYIPLAIGLLFSSSIMGLKVYLILASIASGITMYFFTLKITKNRYAATVSAVLYMLVPYKLTDLFSRNAVGEYTAFIFIPLLFNGLYELIYGNRNKHFLIILGAVGLVLSHTITTVYIVLFTIAFLLLHPKKVFKKEKILKLLIDVIIILLICSFFIIPLLEYKSFGEYSIFNETKMGTSPEKVQGHAIYLGDFFNNEFVSFIEGEADPLIVTSIGISAVLLSLVTLFVYNKLDEDIKKIYYIFWIFSLISLWMCTPYFPWAHMPKFMGVIQFAWRMMGFFIFFNSFVCGLNAYLLIKNLKHGSYIIGIAILTIIIVLGTIRCMQFKSNFDLVNDKNYENNLNTSVLNYRNVNKEYLPLKASNDMAYMVNRFDAALLIDDESGDTLIDTGDIYLADEEKNLLSYHVEISNLEESAKFELPYLYYPGYLVTLNGKELPIFESNNGFIATEIKENGYLEVRYTGTFIEKFSYLTTLLGILGFIIYYNYERKLNLKYDNA